MEAALHRSIQNGITMNCVRLRLSLLSAILFGLSLTSTAYGQAVIEDGPLAAPSNDSAASDAATEVETSGERTYASLSDEENRAIAQITTTVHATEWLGAMAPVALSPFFGLTCLSGIAIAGDDYLPDDHYLRRASSPLKRPIVFATFLLLTVLTSVPKFSKVSKPFAQAVDQLEAYSAIIVLLVIRYLGSTEPTNDQVAVVFEAGVFEFSAETFLWIVTAINIIVINSVKFFFEVLVWITPIPTLDAIFELCNKTLCAVLMAIYAFSPFAATVLNLVILTVCLFAFRWVKRRELYFRTMLIDLLRDVLKRDPSVPSSGITVFPRNEFQGVPALSKCRLVATETGWSLRCGRLFRPTLVREWESPSPTVHQGLLANELVVGEQLFKFGRRHNREMDQLCDQFRLNRVEENADENSTSGKPIAAELT